MLTWHWSQWKISRMVYKAVLSFCPILEFGFQEEMNLLPKLILFLGLVRSFQAQDPRKRSLVSPFMIDWPEESDNSVKEAIGCTSGGCTKRSDTDGPFWANRGKKDPNYLQSKLYAQEPIWVYLSDEHYGYNEPFFVTRGKKRFDALKRNQWLLKELGQDKRTEGVPGPFFAARGKKNLNDF